MPRAQVSASSVSLLFFACALSTFLSPRTSGQAQLPPSFGLLTNTPARPVAGADRPSDPAQAIPLAEIADRAEALDHLVAQISGELLTTAELSEVEEQTESQEHEILDRSSQTKELLSGPATSMELEDEQRYWRSKSEQYSAQRRDLKTRVANLQQQIYLLETQQSEWQLTWDQVRNVQGIEAIADRVHQQLGKAQATRLQAQDQLNSVLTLQNRVSQEDQQVTEILFRVHETRQRDRGRIFQPDSSPLWRIGKTRESDLPNPEINRFFERSLTGAAEFLRTHKLATAGLALTYLFILAGLFALKRYLVSSAVRDNSVALLQLLRAPYSMALLLGLLATGEYVTSAPTSIAFIFYLLYVLPVLRLLPSITQLSLQLFVFAAASFYAVAALCLFIQFPLFLSRIVYAFLIGSAIATLVYILRLSHVREIFRRGRWMQLFALCVYLDLGFLIASLLTNIVGFFSLSQLLGTAALIGPFVAASLYCVARVLTLIASVGLDSQHVAGLFQIHTGSARWWSERIIGLAAVFVWFKTILQLLTVYEGITRKFSELLQRPIGFEKVHFTAGSILGIVVVMIGGYVVAKTVILLLQTVVLPRVPLQRGLPYAITRITYYVLLLMVALFALSAAGVELNKFTVLTGALGVGLGFGLQNIVNNFVSGIILLCERPIHVEDTVEISGLVGVVRRIGARSSTVLTFQGAEVIVPNSNLLSDIVINWTLSSQLRRVDIKIGVAYGTDPERVIKLLVDVAQSHPGVLTDRPPAAFFMGFGESVLNFELRFWCSRQDLWFQLQSDVTVAVAKALHEARIEVPFPQRELHLHGLGFRSEDPLAATGARWPDLPDAHGKSIRV